MKAEWTVGFVNPTLHQTADPLGQTGAKGILWVCLNVPNILHSSKEKLCEAATSKTDVQTYRADSASFSYHIFTFHSQQQEFNC